MTNNVVNLKFDFFLIYFTILYGNTHTVCKKLYYKRDISVFIKIGSHIGRHLGFWRNMQEKLLKDLNFWKGETICMLWCKFQVCTKNWNEWSIMYIKFIWRPSWKWRPSWMSRDIFGPTSLLKSTWSKDNFLKVSCLYHNLHYFDSRDLISRPTI